MSDRDYTGYTGDMEYYYRMHEEGQKEAETFEDSECWQILDSLAKIDRARVGLVRSQNALVIMLEGMTDCAREEFLDFYRAGGITARDWKRYLDGPHPRPTVVRGHLRLVISHRTRLRPRVVNTDPPEAA